MGFYSMGFHARSIKVNNWNNYWHPEEKNWMLFSNMLYVMHRQQVMDVKRIDNELFKVEWIEAVYCFQSTEKRMALPEL